MTLPKEDTLSRVDTQMHINASDAPCHLAGKGDLSNMGRYIRAPYTGGLKWGVEFY